MTMMMMIDKDWIEANSLADDCLSLRSVTVPSLTLLLDAVVTTFKHDDPLV